MENKLEHMMNNKSSWTPADRANFTRTWTSYMAGSHIRKIYGQKKMYASAVLPRRNTLRSAKK